MSNKTYCHVPTGRTCTIVKTREGQAFCNFGLSLNPVGWVNSDELRPDFLPDVAYAEHPATGETVLIRNGERGFFGTQFARCDPSVLNARLGCSPAAAAALLAGSLFGFTCGAVREYNEVPA